MPSTYIDIFRSPASSSLDVVRVLRSCDSSHPLPPPSPSVSLDGKNNFNSTNNKKFFCSRISAFIEAKSGGKNQKLV